MVSRYDETADLLLDQITMELLLKSLTPKERDILVLWLNGGYSRQEIAEIIKARYIEYTKLDGKTLGVKIQGIISKLRNKINPKRSEIRKRTRRIRK